jgi:hypothetical protein
MAGMAVSKRRRTVFIIKLLSVIIMSFISLSSLSAQFKDIFHFDWEGVGIIIDNKIKFYNPKDRTEGSELVASASYTDFMLPDEYDSVISLKTGIGVLVKNTVKFFGYDNDNKCWIKHSLFKDFTLPTKCKYVFSIYEDWGTNTFGAVIDNTIKFYSYEYDNRTGREMWQEDPEYNSFTLSGSYEYISAYTYRRREDSELGHSYSFPITLYIVTDGLVNAYRNDIVGNGNKRWRVIDLQQLSPQINYQHIFMWNGALSWINLDGGIKIYKFWDRGKTLSEIKDISLPPIPHFADNDVSQLIGTWVNHEGNIYENLYEAERTMRINDDGSFQYHSFVRQKPLDSILQYQGNVFIKSDVMIFRPKEMYRSVLEETSEGPLDANERAKRLFRMKYKFDGSNLELDGVLYVRKE